MVVDLVIFLFSLGVLAASTEVVLRAHPDRRIGPRERLAYPWRYYVLLFLGVVLWVIGGQRLQGHLGGWFFPVSLLLVVAVTYGRVLLHNQALSRRSR